MPRAHRHCPKIMAGHIPAAQQLVRGEEARRCCPLHEGNREVAPNAIAGQHDPRVRRLHGKPLVPRISALERGVVIDQEFLRNDAGRLELGIDPVQFGQ